MTGVAAGSLCVGGSADLVAVSEEGKLIASLVNGRL